MKIEKIESRDWDAGAYLLFDKANCSEKYLQPRLITTIYALYDEINRQEKLTKQRDKNNSGMVHYEYRVLEIVLPDNLHLY